MKNFGKGKVVRLVGKVSQKQHVRCVDVGNE